MLALLKTAWSAASGALGGVWGYVAAGVVSAALAGYASYAVTAAFKDNTIKDMTIAQQAAVVKAYKKGWVIRDKQQEETRKADLDNAYQQGKLAGNTKEILRYVTKYVTVQDDARCKLPVGFERVLDAAGLGVPVDELPNRSSEPDSAGSSLSLSDATALLADNLGTCAGLRARIVNARDDWAAQETVAKPSPQPN